MEIHQTQTLKGNISGSRSDNKTVNMSPIVSTVRLIVQLIVRWIRKKIKIKRGNTSKSNKRRQHCSHSPEHKNPSKFRTAHYRWFPKTIVPSKDKMRQNANGRKYTRPRPIANNLQLTKRPPISMGSSHKSTPPKHKNNSTSAGHYVAVIGWPEVNLLSTNHLSKTLKSGKNKKTTSSTRRKMTCRSIMTRSACCMRKCSRGRLRWSRSRSKIGCWREWGGRVSCMISCW